MLNGGSPTFTKDSVVEQKWRNQAGNQLLRPTNLWNFYSNITTGTTLPKNACNVDGTTSVAMLDLEAIMPSLTSGSTDLPNTAVDNFDSKLHRTLFPVNRSFFMFDVPTKQLEELGVDAVAANTAVEKAVAGCMDILKKKRLYSVLPSLFENCTVTGNGLLYMGLSFSDKIQFISPADFVWRRTASGDVREIIIREVIALEDVHDKDLKKALIEDAKVDFSKHKSEDNNNAGVLEAVQAYIYVQIDHTGKQLISRYVGPYKVGKTITKSANEPIFIPVAPTLPVKSQYGIGKVKNAVSSILQIRNATQAYNNMNNLIASMKIAIAPSAYNAVKDSASNTGSKYIPLKSADDMKLMPWGNVNMQGTDNSFQIAKSEISRIFQMDSGLVRDAERVTAEEIRLLAEELNAANADLLSSYADQLQEPLVKYALYHLELEDSEGNSVTDAIKELEVRILTGTEAIGKVSESDNLSTMLVEVSRLKDIPEDVRPMLKIDNIVKMYAQGRGLQTAEIVKSQEEMAQEAQAAKESQQEAQAAEMQAQAMNGQQPQ